MIVIGNGQSRKKINLNKVYKEKIGCNAVYRDTYTDYIVCCDKRMVKQVLAHGHPHIFTRQRWFHDFNHECVNPLPDLPETGKDRRDDPFHWGSGPYAVLLGASMDTCVEMVGFDLYGINGKVNNIYSDTDGYSSSDKGAIDHSYWEYQIGKVFSWFPKTYFKIYNEPNWIMPDNWKKFSNVSLDITTNL